MKPMLCKPEVALAIREGRQSQRQERSNDGH